MRNSYRRTVAVALAIIELAARPGLARGQAGVAGTAGGADTLLTAPAAPALSAPRASPPTNIRWYHATAALAAVALSSLADESLRDELQSHRTAGKDDFAAVVRRMGQPEVYGVVGLGTIAVGIMAGNPRLRRAGQRISAGLLTAAFVSMALKESVGRRRPNTGRGAYSFSPFSGAQALPSGHTTMAFALAAGVADEVHSTPVAIGLYTGAALTGWSRLNDNKHWLSDVAMGALVGVTSAKLMGGRWRVLGVHAPKFLLEPGAVGVSLRF